jgi:hypothetical protein
MQIFSTFEHNLHLELALSKIEKTGVFKEDIFAVPLDIREEDRKLFDTIHRSDGVSLIDIGVALGTAFSVVTASIGFKLVWGPIYWGLIGAFTGFVFGFLIKLFFVKVIQKRKRVLRGKHSEVIIIINCQESQAESIEQILWDHLAIGVAKIRFDNQP